MYSHFISAYPKEGCGIIQNNKFVPIENIAEGDQEFIFSSKDWIAAQMRGPIQALVHSHPKDSCYASAYDFTNMEHFNHPFIIMSLKNLEIGIYI